MNEYEANYRKKTIEITKKLLNELRFVLDDINEKLDSGSESKQAHAVIHANALFECLKQYEKNFKKSFEQL